MLSVTIILGQNVPTFHEKYTAFLTQRHGVVSL